jgi:hypothetical protein
VKESASGDRREALANYFAREEKREREVKSLDEKGKGHSLRVIRKRQ